MFTAEARITTDRPSRYLVQLCQHIGYMSDKSRPLRHRPPGDEPGRDQVEIAIVEASDTDAIVDFVPWGRCTMRAELSQLTLHLEGAEEENLRRLQEILTRNLTQFGRREQLQVNWDRPHTDVESAAPKRKAHWPVLVGMIAAKLAIIALIMVLPSGLALSLGASHLVALAVLLVAAAAAVIVLKLRGKPVRPALSMLRHKGHR